jgi:hypothetical protein
MDVRRAADPVAAVSRRLRLESALSPECNYPFRSHTIYLDSDPADVGRSLQRLSQAQPIQIKNIEEDAAETGSWHTGCCVDGVQ